jgi:hypothetical protein
VTGGVPRERESLRTWFRRLRFNFFPAFRATGARVTWIAEDLRALRIELPLNLRTKNIYGTLFGGSMYAATDPLYAILIKVGLGPGYIIWDKVGAIRYRKPGRSAGVVHAVVRKTIYVARKDAYLQRPQEEAAAQR